MVSHTLKIMNWLSITMISVAVVPSFMHSHLAKSTSFELRRGTLLITLCIEEWQSNWGILEGSWLSNKCESCLWPQCWQNLPVRIRSFSRNENKRCSACICPGGLYSNFILIYIFGDTYICISCLQKNSIISNWDGYYSSMKSKSSFENVSTSPFFSFISLQGIRVCNIYMPFILSCYLRWIILSRSRI